jgi:threonine synthase
MPVIDFHTHFYPPEYLAALDEGPSNVRISHDDEGNPLLHYPGDYNVAVPGHRDVDFREADVTRRGADLQVLTLTTPGTHIETPQTAARLAALTNDALARVARDRPAHFTALATLPLNDPAASTKELERAVRQLHLRGAMLFSNVNGVPLADERFWPLYETANDLGAVFFIHPTSPVGVEAMTEYWLMPLVGFLCDTTLAAANLVFSGVAGRFPRIRWVLAHLGGAIPYLAERLDRGYGAFPECRSRIQQPPSHFLKRFFYDTVNFDPAAIELAVGFAGVGQILAGSDYPHRIGSIERMRKSIEALSIPEADRDPRRECPAVAGALAAASGKFAGGGPRDSDACGNPAKGHGLRACLCRQSHRAARFACRTWYLLVLAAESLGRGFYTVMVRAYLSCVDPACGQSHPLAVKMPKCAVCGGLLDVTYEFDRMAAADLRRLWRDRLTTNHPTDRSGVWRFRELLPFLPSTVAPVTLGEGSTPLVDAPRAGRWAGDVRLSVKHLGANPTGSFKDLGMTACISAAVATRQEVVACASTGNTSSSMAAYAARAGLPAVMFVPYQGISAAKLAQAIEFGARVIEVRGSFDDAFRVLQAVAADRSLHLVNSINPFRLEGQKTAVVELLEQRTWRAPDFLVLPGGNLGNVSAMGKGLRELASLEALDRPPRLVVVQAAGAAPFSRSWNSGETIEPVPRPETEASAIRIGRPANWPKARRELDWTRGLVETVTDPEIEEAKAALATDGIGCEPASAATVAGVRKLRQRGRIPRSADVVVVLTGHQLKDPDYIVRHQTRPDAARVVIDPEPQAALGALDTLLAR